MTTIITGPMASSKTKTLIHFIGLYKHPLVVKPFIDTRSDNCIRSHDGDIYPAKTYKNIADINIAGYDSLFIDEGQFFDDLDLLKNFNIPIFVAGLDLNYKREIFMQRIEGYYIYLTSTCYKCQKCAPFTKKLIDNDDEILIGGLDLYQPICEEC